MGKDKMESSKLLKRRRRRRGLFIFEIIVLVILISGLIVYAKINSALGNITGGDLDITKVGVNEGVANDEALHGYTTIALVGLDTRTDSDDQTRNSDTMIIASIDHDNKNVKLASLYRDTYLNIGKKYDEGNDIYTKANAAYAVGGPEQFLTMLNKNLDLDVSDYVTVNFDVMVKVIDLLEGLDFDLSENETVFLNDYCKEISRVTGEDYEELPKLAGKYHLNGVQSVAYARIRYTAGGDFTRTQRQRAVIYKMVEKAKNSDLAKLSKILDVACQPDMIESSLTKSEMLKMGMDMLTYDIAEQTGFPFYHREDPAIKEVMGDDYVLPITLKANVIALHEFLYSGAVYLPSSTVEEYSNKIVGKSGYGEEDIPQNSDNGQLPIEAFQ